VTARRSDGEAELSDLTRKTSEFSIIYDNWFRARWPVDRPNRQCIGLPGSQFTAGIHSGGPIPAPRLHAAIRADDNGFTGSMISKLSGLARYLLR
jgi:hypothetical protein